MVEKKLITLACAIGILACGACFLPPLPEHRPPPPPPLPQRLALAGIQSIRVSVTNTSELHRLNPSDLARAVTKSINEQVNETGVSAYDQRYAGDAVLEIQVLSESSKPFPSGQKGMVFEVTISATLTRKGGDVMWRETSVAYPIACFFAQADSSDVRNEPSVRNWVMSTLSNRLVNRMTATP
jgi:hypothetical protein